MDDPDEKKRPWREGLIFIAVGTELVVFTVIGWFAGSWLDEQWESAPWAMVTGIFVGAALGFVHLFRIARRFF